VDKGWTCDLIPPSLIVKTYFGAESEQIEKMEADKESLNGQMEEMEETHGGEEGFFSQLDKVNKANVAKRLKELKGDKTAKDEVKVLQDYLDVVEQVATLNSHIKAASEDLDKLAYNRYKKLSEQDIKSLVVEGKWMMAIEHSVKSEMERISQRLTQRAKELIERYESPLPEINKEVAELEKKVNAHLLKMGYSMV
jgi:type I restriction enzyme M protein